MASHLKEARRKQGSESIKDRTRFLERSYHLTKKVFERVYPFSKRIAPNFTEKLVIWGEKTVKGYVFNCQMCGQCILHSTGMTCPMTCPKNLRNGPCGGVRANGHCEVIPERKCVWVQAWERSQQLQHYTEEMNTVQPPVDRTLEGTSSWINMAEGTDQVLYWNTHPE